jgi:hypothetical protein
MNQPDHPSLLTVDAAQQMRQAAKAMRDLAFGLEQYAAEPSFSAVNKISHDLSRVGWNAIYTSLLMAELAEAMQEENGNPQGRTESSHFFQHLDALLTAINYFSRSIIRLKRIGKNLRGTEEIKPHWTELYDRLKEVSRECKSF